MSTVYVNKMIESDFNSIKDLMNLFYNNAYNGIVLGIKSGNKIATVEQKKPYRGQCGWLISYGTDLGKAYIVESKATSPSDFKQSILCTCNYYVDTL